MRIQDVILALCVPAAVLGQESAPRPNLVVIMADDMGYSDLGCYGGEISTPHLDRLAAGGLRFTHFYNTGRCCPTRASLLTGRYAHQAGVGHMTCEDTGRGEDKGWESYRGELNRSSATFAEVLSAAGYRTLMAGKWHVGTFPGMGPMDRGFDRYYGILRGASNHFKPDPKRLLTRGRRPVSPGPDWYSSDAFTDAAIGFVREAMQAGDEPFALYLSFTAPHWPMHAHPQDIERYAGRYDGGWDDLRHERHARMKELGVITQDCPLSPLDVPPWSEINADRKDVLADRMEIYAAMVDRLDQNVGRLVATLRELDVFEDTLVLFLIDNGGCAEGGLMGGGKDELVGTEQGYWLTYGKGWANVSNTPFRRYKHWVHEGGVSSPLIAHWPAGIAARGALYHEPCHLIDIAPTLAELAGARHPTRQAGIEVGPMEGVPLTPAFSDRSLGRAEPIFFEHEGNRAVRRGPWKLVAAHKQAWQLFNIDEDRSETHDRAATEPELAAELEAAFDAWAARCGVRPWPVKRREGFTPPEYPYPLTAPQLQQADGARGE